MKRYTFYACNYSNGGLNTALATKDDLADFNLSYLKNTALSLDLKDWFVFDNLRKTTIRKGKFWS